MSAVGFPPPALLSLPVELRTTIYEDVLRVNTPSGKVVLHHQRTPNFEHPSVLCLLLTCRQIHDEAVSLFYLLNHFVLDSPDLRELCYHGLASDRQNAIRALTISTNSMSGLKYHVEGYLTGLRGLRVLVIKVNLRRGWPASLTLSTAFNRELVNVVASLPSLEDISIDVSSELPLAFAVDTDDGVGQAAEVLQAEIRSRMRDEQRTVDNLPRSPTLAILQ